jgi:hypothetical protein
VEPRARLASRTVAIDPIPRGAELRVLRAWWGSSTRLWVVVELDNRFPMPLPVGPASFALATSGGPASAVANDHPGACAFDAVVMPEDRGRCVLSFEPASSPLEVRHRPSGAAAPVAACAPERRRGLCPPEQACVQGACETICSPTTWDGVCLDDDEICDQGECTPRCSPEDPIGACEEGRCVGGECRLDCASIAWPDDACFACAWDAIELERCDPGPEECRACIDCPGEPTGEPGRYRYPTTCDCLERPSCDGCATEATSFWDCLLDQCPACGE